jgi:hypothetical protein
MFNLIDDEIDETVRGYQTRDTQGNSPHNI